MSRCLPPELRRHLKQASGRPDTKSTLSCNSYVQSLAKGIQRHVVTQNPLRLYTAQPSRILSRRTQRAVASLWHMNPTVGYFPSAADSYFTPSGGRGRRGNEWPCEAQPKWTRRVSAAVLKGHFKTCLLWHLGRSLHLWAELKTSKTRLSNDIQTTFNVWALDVVRWPMLSKVVLWEWPLCQLISTLEWDVDHGINANSKMIIHNECHRLELHNEPACLAHNHSTQKTTQRARRIIPLHRGKASKYGRGVRSFSFWEW